MSELSARLELPYLQPSQAQKHVTHNEALERIDALLQLVLEQTGAETPPATPALGTIYALGAAPINEWAGRSGMLAQWLEPGWQFITPQEGWSAWDRADGGYKVFDGTGWIVSASLQNLDGVGVGTMSDAVNRLSVSADATLLSHAGSGHQLKLNKAASGDTASLLYQSNWNGHAEMGLTGDNDFHVKVSPDGQAWTEALVVAASGGTVSGAAVQSQATDTTPGKLARADYVYGPGNLLGTVGQAGGVPTGAVFETGSNGNGAYVRFADGTQICTNELTLNAPNVAFGSVYQGNSGVTWIFPAAFAGGTKPSVMASDTNVGRLFVTAFTGNNVQAGMIAMRAHPVATPPIVNAVAIGRWF